MKKNISILCPKEEFTIEQLQKLEFLNNVSYADSKSGLENQVKVSKDTEILGFYPDLYGKHASRILLEILESCPNIKGVALNAVNIDCVDKQYCQERGIAISVVPDCTTEAVAEHILALLLCASKRIIINDRRTYRRRYQPELGQELRGKMLGVIGLGPIGERVAKLGQGIGMSVIAYNEPITRMEHVARGTIGEVLYRADAVVINLALNEETKGLLSKERINNSKEGVIIINMANRLLVNEKALAEALKSGQVSQYVFEAQSIKGSPFDDIETALVFKPFASFTKESMQRSIDWWASNIKGLARGAPHHPASLE